MKDLGGEVKGKKHTYQVEVKMRVPKDDKVEIDTTIDLTATDEAGVVRKTRASKLLQGYTNTEAVGRFCSCCQWHQGLSSCSFMPLDSGVVAGKGALFSPRNVIEEAIARFPVRMVLANLTSSHCLSF